LRFIFLWLDLILKRKTLSSGMWWLIMGCGGFLWDVMALMECGGSSWDVVAQLAKATG
jgi:hypothetical protein